MEPIDVVVIDDDESVLWFLKELLSNYGISYKAAGSGQQGLELIKEHQPKLAVIDFKLGSMTGLEVASELGSLSQKTEILFITGYSGAVAPEVLNELPVLAVLEKPFDVGEFIDLVQKAVQ